MGNKVRITRMLELSLEELSCIKYQILHCTHVRCALV